MELRGEDIAGPNHRSEFHAVFGGGRDHGILLGGTVIAVDKIDIAAVGNSGKQRTGRLANVEPVPPHVRNF